MAEDKIAAFTTAREQLREYIAECDKQIDAALEECETKVSRLTTERDRALEELGERVEPKTRADKGGTHRRRKPIETPQTTEATA